MVRWAFSYMLTLVAVLCALCFSAPAASAATTEQMLQEIPLKSCEYNYSAGTNPTTASVFYSHALLFQDSATLSPDLAKASVALSVTSYNAVEVNRLLTDMGFDPEDNSEDYAWCDGSLTFLDCDYVAFTIATKTLIHPITNEEYMLYCVPIRGTPMNLEWFSDFNMGAGDEHLGFQRASKDIYDRLLRHFQTDGIEDPSRRILWLTGHSRGAACANLLAGWFSDGGYTYVAKENLFAYTFACPAVSKNADTTLDNIFNFNNPGDLVPMLPVPEWGFARYGQTYLMDTQGRFFENFNQQFAFVTGTAYAGETDDTAYRALLSDISKSEDFQLILDLVSVTLSKANEEVLAQIIRKHIPSSPDALLAMVSDLRGKANLFEWVDLLYGRDEQNMELIRWAGEAFDATYGMPESDFSAYVQANMEMIWKIQNISGVMITDPDSFRQAQRVLEADSRNLVRFALCADAAARLLFGENGNALDKVLHGHSSPTYHTWINAKFYGYGGWRGNTDITELSLDNSYFSIGKCCFESCTGLTEIVIPDSVTHAGDYAFANCSGLRTVTMPADLKYTEVGYSTFINVTGVNTICYTPGSTGIMYDRAYIDTSRDTDRLEFESINSLKYLRFEDGITYISARLCQQRNGDENTVLEAVSFPSTLKSIGEAAFFNCPNAVFSEWPEGLTTIGKRTFYNCDQLTSHPSTLTAFPEGCFSSCDGLTSVTIPNHFTQIGDDAFSFCGGLRTVTMPVDLRYNTAFQYVGGVISIRYTPGATGIMHDRAAVNASTTTYRLEYQSIWSLRDIYFEDGITYIGSYLCQGENGNENTVLKTVSFPSTLEAIGSCAFYNCPNAVFSDWPEGLTTIGEGTFYNCDQLTSHPLTLTGYPANSFNGCDGITSITIPDSVAAVGDYAFVGCSSARTLTIPADLTFGWNSFGGGFETVYYTKGTTGRIPNCAYIGYDGYSTHPVYLSGGSLKELVFDEGVTHIGNYLCCLQNGKERTVLETVLLPSTLEAIGSCAFYNCIALEPITFTGNAPAIGSNAFRSVTTTAYYPQGNTTWTEEVRQNYGGNITWKPLACTGEHTYGDPVFDWTTELTCSASVSCKTCAHSLTADCTVTAQPGEEKLYTAEAVLNGTRYADTKSLQDVHTSHIPGDQWHRDSDTHWKQCVVCSDKMEPAAHIPAPETGATTAQRCSICGFVIRLPLGLEWFADRLRDPESILWATGNYGKIMEQYGSFLN